MQKEKKPIMFWILAGAIILLALIFAIENRQTMSVSIFFMDLKGPGFILITVIFLLGFFLGRIYSLIKRRKKKQQQKEYASYKELPQDNLEE